jgi:hypothetical protein
MDRGGSYADCPVACGSPGDADRGRVTREAEAAFKEARNATLVGGAVRVADTSGPRRDGMVVSAEWSFKIRTDWNSYLRDVTAALGARGYRQTLNERSAVAFVKTEPGDLYSVRLRPPPEDPGPGLQLEIVATFSAAPD